MTATRSKPGPAFTAPLRTCSPRSRSTGRDSPVSADSSRTATSAATIPSTGTTSPCFTSSRSPGSTCVDPHRGQVLILVAMHRSRRAGQQRRQLAPGPVVCVGLERLPAREHERDDRPRQVLAQGERTGHRQQRDEIHPRLAPDEPDERLPCKRDDADRGRDPPRRVRDARRSGQCGHASGDDADDRSAEQRSVDHQPPPLLDVGLRRSWLAAAPRCLAHESRRRSSPERCSVRGVSSVCMSSW